MENIYKRYFFDFCFVYNKLRKDKDEPRAAYDSISRMQAIFIWGVFIFHKAIYGGSENIFLVILVIAGSLVVTHMINYKWIKVFRGWKSELPPKSKQTIKLSNFYLWSTLFILIFTIAALITLLFNK